MIENSPGEDWQVRLHKPRLGVLAQPIRPAEVSAVLSETMLARENLLEDAEYQKIVPNHFIVELALENYNRNYQPLEKRICEQWRDKLLNHLATTNSRQGRREYRFAGQVLVEMRPAADLEFGHVRILSRLRPDALEAHQLALLPACLELLPEGRQWRLREGLVTIGREPGCDIYLDLPRVQDGRLVSGQHAYLQCSAVACRLFDGTPQGVPSVNGTFVNKQPVPPSGQLLRDDDILILAAVRPRAPVLDTPGVAGLRFRSNCE